MLIAATPRWADWFLPFWPIPDDRIDYLRALRPLDPIERIGSVGDAEVLFQFGRRDFFIAPMTGLEFRGAAPDGRPAAARTTTSTRCATRRSGPIGSRSWHGCSVCR